jgi:hypothetical protein
MAEAPVRGIRALTTMVGFAILSGVTALAVGPESGQGAQLLGARAGVVIIGALVLMSRLRKHHLRVSLEK